MLLQSLADAARRMVATGSVRLFRLRGLRPEEVTFRFLARDVPGPGYRSYVLAAEGTEMPGEHRPRHPARAPGSSMAGGPPRPAAIYQPDPGEEFLADGVEDEVYPGVPTVGEMDPTEGYLIENDFYMVEAAAQTGWLTITDKATGLIITGGNRFVDAGDCGDEYTYCPPAEDQVITGFSAPPRIDMHYTPLGSSLVIEGTLLLPAWLSEDRRGRSAAQVSCPVRSTVRLLHGVRRVDISTTVDNQAGDHWLRVLFDVPVQTDVVGGRRHVRCAAPSARSAGGRLDLAGAAGADPPAEDLGRRGRRAARRAAGEPGPARIRSAAAAGRRGRDPGADPAALCRLAEPRRSDDATGPRRAGAAHAGRAVPGAAPLRLCAGAVRGGARSPAGPTAQAHSFNVPLRALAEDFHPGPLPPTDTLVIIEPDELVISALKRSADGEAVILRAWNISAAPVQARIVPPPFLRAARLVRLDETPAADAERLQSIPDAPGWRIDLRPRELCTVRLEV